MQKKIIGIFAIVAIIATASLNFKQNKYKIELSDLALANIEALARGEGDGSGEGYTEQEYICGNCGATFIGCFWCTEEPNKCNCEVTEHTCS